MRSANHHPDVALLEVEYDSVHGDMAVLYRKLSEATRGGAVIIAIARGGWMTARILASFFEEDGIVSYSYSIGMAYQSEGLSHESVVITQGLDEIAFDAIRGFTNRGLPILIIDSVCHTGRELSTARDYVANLFPQACVMTAVMNLVDYVKSPRSPWRNVELRPDFFGTRIRNTHPSYIDYPWEHGLHKNLRIRKAS